MDKDNGGSAYPLTGMQHMHGQPVQTVFNQGMTLRDYFAAQAMAGLLACPQDFAPPETHTERAVFAYDQADAMLAAR